MTGFPETFENAPPRTLAADICLTELYVAVALMGRRSRALADFWQAAPLVREPGELLALQLGYWSQMVDDYAAAFNETYTPIVGRRAGEAAPATETISTARAA